MNCCQQCHVIKIIKILKIINIYLYTLYILPSTITCACLLNIIHIWNSIKIYKYRNKIKCIFIFIVWV